ncbi:MAG: class I SAM-dependent methyltransferase [Bacteroidota bacterium]|nr:class I SAM-dependent methyltransferase [Bacteroidota bacterium]
MTIKEEQHNIEIHQNLHYWDKKPVLQKIYNQFYKLIAREVNQNLEGEIVELGSGIGNLKTEIPKCICTDIFFNPWIDQTENAYKLSFSDQSVSNLILFDVWHHLEFPGTVLQEFERVLKPGGRVIIFDPAISVLGSLVYGLFHHEPISFMKKISWLAPLGFSYKNASYYAAQGNATRIFKFNKYRQYFSNWNVVKVKTFSAISYVASGGYSGRQLYPDSFFSKMKYIDKICNLFPLFFATRILVVLEKRDNS